MVARRLRRDGSGDWFSALNAAHCATDLLVAKGFRSFVEIGGLPHNCAVEIRPLKTIVSAGWAQSDSAYLTYGIVPHPI